MKIAIITGASAGMGWEFARQLDGTPEIDEMWLIARRRDRLQELANTLEHSRCRIFAIDLTDPEQTRALFDALEEEKPDVSWLINNAGFGKIGPFDSVDVETNLSMIDLNVRVLTEITQRALPYCGAGSRILQIASTAGFLPITNFSVYAASKAYVLSLSNALARELKPRGITVTAVCPGPVQTEFLEAASTNGSKMDAPDFVMAMADKVVRQAIADARKGRLNSVYGFSAKSLVSLTRILPRHLALWATERTYG
ncbi:MAG: SDR family NAD(P)-dependent oxidoreductase [Bradymonadaceae bacterium]